MISEHHKPVQQPQAPAFAIFDDYRPAVAIAVVIRWTLLASWLILNNYRVHQDGINLALNLMGVGIAALNAYMTWRILAKRPITWRHALSLSLADIGTLGKNAPRYVILSRPGRSLTR